MQKHTRDATRHLHKLGYSTKGLEAHLPTELARGGHAGHKGGSRHKGAPKINIIIAGSPGAPHAPVGAGAPGVPHIAPRPAPRIAPPGPVAAPRAPMPTARPAGMMPRPGMPPMGGGMGGGMGRPMLKRGGRAKGKW